MHVYVAIYIHNNGTNTIVTKCDMVLILLWQLMVVNQANLLLPLFPNIGDFNILLALFDHSSYSKKNLELLFTFLTYFIIQSTLSTTFRFLYLYKFFK